MTNHITQVEKALRITFSSASNIYIDTENHECEVTLSVDDYQGELDEMIYENGVLLTMVDYSDNYPFKYVFDFAIKAEVTT